MHTKPKLRRLINNNFGSFLCAWGAVLSVVVAIIAFSFNKYQFTAGTDTGWVAAFISTSLSGLCLLLVIMWWHHQVQTTYSNGIELDAMTTKKEIGFGLAVYYSFIYQGKDLEHIEFLVPNSRTSEILNKKNIKIIYNPDKNISFIKEAYCELYG